MSGKLALRGPVKHCEAGNLHDGKPRPERPLAVYLMYALPCEVPSCVGRLVCVGHGVCPECAARVRADQTVWSDSGNDVDLVLVHGASR